MYAIYEFLATRIELGKLEFKQVPPILKDGVKGVLTERGLHELIIE